MTAIAQEWQPVEIECRAAKVVDVSFPKRLIQVVVMPYESPTVVEHHGRLIEEIVTRGAFGNIEGRRNVKVNRGHVIERVVGRAVRFQSDHQDGLLAELKIGNTADAEETLSLANDGLLGASAGFTLKTVPSTRRAEPNAETWETTTRRRLNKIWLHHIALTADPAYESAEVLDVRATVPAPPPPVAQVATPLLDEVRLWRFNDKYGSF